MPKRKSKAHWIGSDLRPGEQRSELLSVSKTYSGMDVLIPIRLWRGKKNGPTVFITAAVHGDEINGTGTIRELIATEPFTLQAGTLVMIPVVNVRGFEQHSRYLPDRRDLNRSFPGSRSGSAASQHARAIFDEIVRHCDYGIDLHTAAIRRTNFPNVRADMTIPELADFARAFGSELIVSGPGPAGSLRNAATKAGCPTIILEAGEVWKVERNVLEYSVRGVRNCLAYLGMIDERPKEPPFRIEADATQWVRSLHGGFLQFHVVPGDIVTKGTPIATNTSLMANTQNVIVAPRDGIVLGMTTMPAVEPGTPVCHLAYAKKGELRKAERAQDNLDDESLHERMREDLASNIALSD